MPSDCSRSPGPMPLSCRSCGEPMAPAARMTSRCARDGAGDAGAAQRDAGRAPPVEKHPLGLRLRHHGQIAAGAHRAQERGRAADAPAAALVDLEVADALVGAAIEVGGFRDAGLFRGVTDRIEQIPAQPLAFHPPSAAGAVNVVHAGVMVLGAAEIRKNIVPGPAGIAELAPVVVVARLAAHVDHAVDRGAAAEDSSARVVERPPVQPRFRLGPVAPVGAGIAHAVQVTDRDLDPDVVVAPAGLQQGDRRGGVLAEPVGEHAAGGAGAHDHVVERPEILHDGQPSAAAGDPRGGFSGARMLV